MNNFVVMLILLVISVVSYLCWELHKINQEDPRRKSGRKDKSPLILEE